MNASLHWDAEESIVAGPAVGNRVVLADARAHLFDVLPLVHSDYPAQITAFFWSEKGLPFHDGLTQCRYYYSFISDWLGHQAFLLGGRWFHTPVGAVLCYQLSALGLIALTLAAMLLQVVSRLQSGHRMGVRFAIVVLTFAAISSSPVMLSIARQMLTETAGFVFLVMTVICCSAATEKARPAGPPLNGVLRTVAMVILLLIAGAFCFLAIRSRYTLGPALGMLLPLIILLNVRIGELRWRRSLLFAVAFALPFGCLVVWDYQRFGPMFLPWIYNDVMVRSSKLMFHADPPYEDFILAMFVNLPMLIIPMIGIWCWIDGRGDSAIPRRQLHWAKLFAAAVAVILAVMLWRTAAQQVKFQGRHLFAFSATAVVVLLIVLPRIRWRAAGMVLYVVITGFFLAWNCCSTFGPQRKHALQYQPDFVTVVAEHLSSAGANAKKSLARDVWNSYFDWADDRVVHDSLVTWDDVNRHRATGALVLLDSAAPKANQLEFYSRQFPAFQICRMRGRADPIALAAARSAISRGQNVYLFTAQGRAPPDGVMESAHLDEPNLLSDALRRVTAVAPAAVYLDSGVATAAASDGLSLARTRGTAKRFDIVFSYLRGVQGEDLSYDSDPSRVTYEVTGLRSGVQYELGFVSWDPDKLGRAMTVSTKSPVHNDLLSAEPIRACARAGSAPKDLRVLLPILDKPAAIEIDFNSVDPMTGVAVCEVWIREVPSVRSDSTLPENRIKK